MSLRSHIVYISLIVLLVISLLYVGKQTHFLYKLRLEHGWVKPTPLPAYQEREIPFMERSVERSWENCLRKMDLQYDVVFYGNSITRNSDFRRYFPELSICNLGHGGDVLDGMIRRVGMIAAFKPKTVFLMAGVNDIFAGIPNAVFEEKYNKLLDIIADSTHTTIILESILPINTIHMDRPGLNQKIDSCNQIIKNIAHNRGFSYVDLYSLYLKDGELPMDYTMNDGLHLNQESYQLWADAISHYIYEPALE